MANIRSALKRVRQDKVRTSRNKAMKTRVKSARKALANALNDKDGQAAASIYRDLISVTDKAVKANVFHRNTSSRFKRIYSVRIAALS